MRGDSTMRLIHRPKIMLTPEEKGYLRNACETVKEIIDALDDNKENGFAAFQEGLDVPEAFWELKALFYRIENEYLIP